MEIDGAIHQNDLIYMSEQLMHRVKTVFEIVNFSVRIKNITIKKKGLVETELLTKCWIFTTIKIRIKKEF